MLPMLLALVAAPPAEAKPPGLLKMLGAAMDPLTGVRASLDAIRQQQDALGPVDGPIVFATALTGTWSLFPTEERSALLAEARAGLDAASAHDPARTDEIEAARGALLTASGDRVGADVAFRKSFAAKPSVAVLGPLLDLAPSEAAALCAAARPSVSAAELGPLVETCNAHGDPLAWASPGDKEAWATWRADTAARQAALDARHAAEAASLAASFSPAPAPAPTAAATASAGPSVTSVTIRSACRQTVRVFFGDKPKFGSGTTTTVSANSVSSYQKRPGDLIWIVDANDNGLSSTSVSGSSMRIEILESCTGFRSY